MPIDNSDEIDRRRAFARSRSRSSRKAAEIASGGVQPAFERSHAHQAANLDVAKLGRPARNGSTSSGAKPPLAASPEMFTSSRIGIRKRQFAGGLIDGLDEPRAVARMDHVDHGQGAADLVSLQVADHVPADRLVAQCRGHLPKVLRPALAQQRATGSEPTRESPPPPTYFVTATSRTSSGRAAARAAASAIRPRTRRDVVGDSGGRIQSSVRPRTVDQACGALASRMHEPWREPAAHLVGVGRSA